MHMDSGSSGLLSGSVGLALALVSCLIVAWGVGRFAARFGPKLGFGIATTQRLATLLVFLGLAFLVVSRG
jgi:hypothetical protein